MIIFALYGGIQLKQTESTKELNIIVDGYRANFCDKLKYDQVKMTDKGEYNRTTMWEVGQHRFHITFTEISPDKSAYKLLTQPRREHGENELWDEIFSLDEFRKKVVEARRTRDLTANEKKAIKGMETNFSDHAPDGIIMTMLSGSHLYGLNHSGLKMKDGTDVKPSDEDIRGVFVIPTAKFITNRFNPKNKVINDFVQIRDTDEKYEEIDRFVYECLKANPERLELLNSPIYTFQSKEWEELTKIRRAFYCKKRIFDALGGYSQAQFMKWRKKEGDLWKPGMHLIRLMTMGVEFFKTGEMNPDMRARRDYLLSIRTGNVKAEQVEADFERLKLEFQKLYDETKLIPEEPDHKVICEYMANLRKDNW